MNTAVSGIAIVGALLFLEEAGLPLPVAPGEAVLIGAGLLIAGGGAPFWLIVPVAYLAVICGVLTGYAWAHRIGPKRVHALAARLHAGGPYDRAASRLRGATPLQIAASRLLPGLRVYTSLVAGAVGVKMGRFMAGVLPASALWVVAFIGAGLLRGCARREAPGPRRGVRAKGGRGRGGGHYLGGSCAPDATVANSFRPRERSRRAAPRGRTRDRSLRHHKRRRRSSPADWPSLGRL